MYTLTAIHHSSWLQLYNMPENWKDCSDFECKLDADDSITTIF